MRAKNLIQTLPDIEFLDLGEQDAQLTIAEESCVILAHHVQEGEKSVTVTIRLKRGAKCIGLLQTNGLNVQVHYRFLLEEPWAQVRFYGLMQLTEKQKCTQDYTVEHLSPHCISDIRFKSVLDHQSRGVFQSHVTVAKNAYKTQALQDARALVLSSQAQQFSKPELRIYHNDVVCRHGATVGSLDTDGLIYIRSRGLSQERARKLLANAFLGSFFEEVQQESPFLAQKLVCL